jgi:HSP20 family molecular chaperone IbpA
LTITVENVTVGTPVVINITANDLFSGEVIVVIGANETPVELIDGIGSLTVSLPADDYTASVYYDGDTYFIKDENSTTFTVSRFNTTFEITHGTPVVDEALDVTVALPGVTGDIKVTVDGKEITVNLVDGKGNFTIAKEDMVVGDHSIAAIFAGNDIFNPTTGNDAFTVNKTEDYDLDVNLTVSDINAGEDLTFNVTLPEDANGTVTVYVNGTPVTSETPVGGVATVTVPASAFAPGENNVTVTYTGDAKYGDKSVSKTIVEKVPADLTASAADINVGDNATITINAPSDVTPGALFVEVNGVTYTPVEGKVIVENLPAGNYTAYVYLIGDAKYIDNTTNASFAVNKVDIDPQTAINVTTPENATAPVITIDLPEDATGTLDVDVDGKHTSVPIVNGKATAVLPKLEPGTYNATITYNSNNSKYASTSTTVPINITSNVPDSAFTIPTSAKSDEKTTFSIKLPTNATGHLDVYVNGKSYSALLENGTATVTVPAQSAGKYNVTVSYTGDDYYNSAVKESVLTVTDPVFKITKNKNISPRYSAKASWKILVTRDGKAVGAGEKVTIKYNGKTYTVKTNSKGYATFKPSTKLKPKKYTVTATYKGAKVTNKITIKTIIKAKNRVFNFKKKSKKSKSKYYKIPITLKKVNGKYLKNKKVTIKFKGKKYTAKTNKKGKATWKLKKSIVKKLKKGKKYKYTVTYGKDKATKKISVKK